jgi:polysaccharide biosynthesis/export protein
MTSMLLTLLLLAGQVPAAQTGPRPADPSRTVPRPADPPQTVTRPADPAAVDEYVVGPQDVLTLTIFNDDTLSRPALIVDNEGTIDMPYINRVKVAGMTTRQIEEELRRLLGVRTDAQGRLRGFLKNPNISVTVKEFRSQRVYVTGAVRIPGFVELQGDPTLTRALAEAGYPTVESGSYVVITHPTEGQSPTSAAPVSVRPEDQIRVPREEIDNGRASRIRLRAGDFIFVPTADHFFITGEVKSTGRYVLNGELNVLQALAMAGGVTDRANKGSIKIERVVNGKKIEVKGKESTLVQAGDTIKVPKRFW